MDHFAMRNFCKAVCMACCCCAHLVMYALRVCRRFELGGTVL